MEQSSHSKTSCGVLGGSPFTPRWARCDNAITGGQTLTTPNALSPNVVMTDPKASLKHWNYNSKTKPIRFLSHAVALKDVFVYA